MQRSNTCVVVKQLISIAAVLVVCGCGGSKSTGPNSTTSAKSPPPSAMEEYRYYLEQAGLAQAEQRTEDALDYYMEAANSLEKAGDVGTQKADAHYEAAMLAYQLYQRELAIEQYEKAAAIYIKYKGNAQTKAAVVYTNMGVIWKELHDKNRARSCWQQALAIYKALPPSDQNGTNIEKINQNIRDLDEGF